MEIIIEKLLDGPKLQALPTQTSTTKDQSDKRIPTKISSKKKATAPVIEDADNGTVQIHSGTKDGPKAKSRKKQAPSIQDSRGQSMQITSSKNRFLLMMKKAILKY